MKHFMLSIVGAFLVIASACSVVTVTEPIGEEPVRLQADEWEGLWKLYSYGPADESDEDFLVIEVSDSEKGVLKVQGIGRESKDTIQVYLRESNGWMFGSYRDPDEGDKGMVWGRFEKKGDHIFIWIPEHDKFSDLVKDGLLPGHPYAKDLLILSGLKPEHLKLITSGSQGMLFHWELPSFMVRVSDDID
jgi:hypothetical protein